MRDSVGVVREEAPGERPTADQASRPSRFRWMRSARVGLPASARYLSWATAKTRFTPTEQQRLFGLTIAIGGACGLVAVAFHAAIEAITHLTIARATNASGDAWMIWMIVVPTLGALIAGILLYFVPGARGSGVPQVKVAYATSVAKLRLRDALGKFGIGALQIGTGSSLGREGPTVQICAGVAKGIGRLGGISPQNLKLLLPVGVAAGIAAAFNAPIAAVTFTIEEIVGKLDQTLLSGVIVAAALAAVVERSMMGETTVFSFPAGSGLEHASSLIVYAALGVAAALVSVAFTESLLRLRARFQAATRIPAWLRPAIGGLVTGVLGVIVLIVVHVGGITGGGAEGLAGALTGDFAIEVLLVLGAAKLVATVVAYASGGAGGIFAPSLFIGAMLGGAFGLLDVQLLGHTHAEVGAFALVGMGAVFAGTVRAPITSVLIIIEMTAGYGLTLPLMISNMVAYVIARRLRPVPIYEALLAQDGVHLEVAPPPDDALDTIALAPLLSTRPLPLVTVSPADTAGHLLAVVARAGHQSTFPVLGADRRVVGLVALDDVMLLAADPELEAIVCAADIMRSDVSVRRDSTVGQVLDLMAALGLRELPVVDDAGQLVGVVDEVTIAHAFVKARAAARGPRPAAAAGS